MYSITRLADGRYLAEGRIQDETLRETCDTEEQAIKHCKGVGQMNGRKVKRKDITFFRTEERLVTVRVPEPRNCRYREVQE